MQAIVFLIWINYDFFFCATHNTLKRHINAGSVILYAKPYTICSVWQEKKRGKTNKTKKKNVKKTKKNPFQNHHFSAS